MMTEDRVPPPESGVEGPRGAGTLPGAGIHSSEGKASVAPPRAPHKPACEQASADDRRFFERHPRRLFRLRRAYPGEDLNREVAHRLVMQHAPGMRWRLPVELDLAGEKAMEAFNNDPACTGVFFELLGDLESCGGEHSQVAQGLLRSFNHARRVRECH